MELQLDVFEIMCTWNHLYKHGRARGAEHRSCGCICADLGQWDIFCCAVFAYTRATVKWALKIIIIICCKHIISLVHLFKQKTFERLNCQLVFLFKQYDAYCIKMEISLSARAIYGAPYLCCWVTLQHRK